MNLLYFSQPDVACPTCRLWHKAGLLSNVEQLLNEPIAKHNAQEEPALATQYGVQSTPTILDVSAGFPRLVYPAPGMPQLPTPEQLAERVRKVRG